MTKSEHGHRHVHYVDPEGVQHDALVTHYWGERSAKPAVNLVYVGDGGTELRATSVVHRDAASGAKRSYHLASEPHHHVAAAAGTSDGKE